MPGGGSLTATALNSTTDQFTLSITGINKAGVDTEGGHLSASGCNGHGNFFCFDANTTPTGPALAANSSFTFVFNVTLLSGTFASYAPGLKIDWVGTKNNYDLVSTELDPSFVSVPGPSVGVGLPESRIKKRSYFRRPFAADHISTTALLSCSYRARCSFSEKWFAQEQEEARPQALHQR
jgi:hypothetical protein